MLQATNAHFIMTENLINRRNVVNDVSKKVSACKKFFMLEVKAQVVAAAINELGMEDIDSSPSEEKFDVNDNDSKEKKIDCIHSLATTVVNKYVLKEACVQSILDNLCHETEDAKCNMEGGRYLCRFPGCTNLFGMVARGDRTMRSHARLVLNKSQVSVPTKEKDDMFNYQTLFLEAGLLCNFYDAILEGDGQRVI